MIDVMDGWGGYGPWGVVPWTLFAVLVLALLVAGAVVVTAVVRGRPGPPRSDEATRILEERFARGEIDEQELEARRRALRRPSP
ncbi:MAG: SHOCT domain-containing protein [Amnibacterium sp.]